MSESEHESNENSIRKSRISKRDNEELEKEFPDKLVDDTSADRRCSGAGRAKYSSYSSFEFSERCLPSDLQDINLQKLGECKASMDSYEKSDSLFVYWHKSGKSKSNRRDAVGDSCSDGTNPCQINSHSNATKSYEYQSRNSSTNTETSVPHNYSRNYEDVINEPEDVRNYYRWNNQEQELDVQDQISFSGSEFVSKIHKSFHTLYMRIIQHACIRSITIKRHVYLSVCLSVFCP